MVSRRNIQKFVDDVVRKFRPKAVILFGSYAYGKPTKDSDVDLMVILRHRGTAPEIGTKIRLACPRDFAMDLIVRTPKEVQERLRIEDPFVREITSKGIYLHASQDA